MESTITKKNKKMENPITKENKKFFIDAILKKLVDERNNLKEQQAILDEQRQTVLMFKHSIDILEENFVRGYYVYDKMPDGMITTIEGRHYKVEVNRTEERPILTISNIPYEEEPDLALEIIYSCEEAELEKLYSHPYTNAPNNKL